MSASLVGSEMCIRDRPHKRTLQKDGESERRRGTYVKTSRSGVQYTNHFRGGDSLASEYKGLRGSRIDPPLYLCEV
eukprot:8291991-Alexandrium_andersonii.AAC.1